jgi:hypothetical protein
MDYQSRDRIYWSDRIGLDQADAITAGLEIPAGCPASASGRKWVSASPTESGVERVSVSEKRKA